MANNDYLNSNQKKQDFENDFWKILKGYSHILDTVTVPLSWSTESSKPLVSPELLKKLPPELKTRIENIAKAY